MRAAFRRKQLFECEYGCGFLGLFQEVAAHERVCTKRCGDDTSGLNSSRVARAHPTTTASDSSSPKVKVVQDKLATMSSAHRNLDDTLRDAATDYEAAKQALVCAEARLRELGNMDLGGGGDDENHAGANGGRDATTTANTTTTTTEAERLMAANVTLEREKLKLRQELKLWREHSNEEHVELCTELAKSSAVIEELHQLNVDYEKLNVEAEGLRAAAAALEATQDALRAAEDRLKELEADAAADAAATRQLRVEKRERRRVSQSLEDMKEAVDSLQGEKEMLVAATVQLEREKEELRRDLELWRESHEHSNEEHAELCAELDESTVVIKQLHADYDAVKAEATRLRSIASAHKTTRQELEASRARVDDLEAARENGDAAAARQLRIEKRERRRVSQSLERTKEVTTALEAEKAMLLGANITLEREKSELRRELELWRASHEHSNEEHADLCAELDKSSAVIEQLNAEYDSLKAEAAELRATARQQLADDTRDDDHNAAEAQNGTSLVPHQQSRNGAVNDEQLRADYDALKSEADELRQLVAAHVASEMALKEELEAVRDGSRVTAAAQRQLVVEKLYRRRSTESLDDSKARVIKLEAEKADLVANFDALEAESEELRESVAAHEAAELALRAELEAVRDGAGVMASAQRQLVVEKGERRRATESNDGFKARATKLEAENATLVANFDTLEAEAEELRESVTAHEAAELALKAELEAVRDGARVMASAQRQLVVEKGERRRATECFEGSKDRVIKLEAEKAALVADFESLKTEAEELRVLVAAREASELTLKAELEAVRDGSRVMASAQRQLMIEKGESRRSNASLDNSNSRVTALEAEKAELVAHFDALKTEADELRDSVAAHEATELALKAELEAVRDGARVTAAAQRQLVVEKLYRRRATECLDGSTARVIALEAEKADLDAHFDALNGEADELRGLVAAHEAAELALKAELEAVRDGSRVMASAQRQLVAEKGERRRATTSLDDAKARVIALEAEKAELVADFDALKAEAEELRASVDTREAGELALKAELDAVRDSSRVMVSAQRQTMAAKGERRRATASLDESKARVIVLAAEKAKLAADFDSLKTEADELRESIAAHKDAELALKAELEAVRDGSRVMASAQRELVVEKGECRRATESLDDSKARTIALVEAEKAKPTTDFDALNTEADKVCDSKAAPKNKALNQRLDSPDGVSENTLLNDECAQQTRCAAEEVKAVDDDSRHEMTAISATLAICPASDDTAEDLRAVPQSSSLEQTFATCKQAVPVEDTPPPAEPPLELISQMMLQLFAADLKDDKLLQIPDELRDRIQASQSFEEAKARSTALEAEKAALIARNKTLCQEKADMQRKRHEEVCEDLQKSNAVVEQLHKLEGDYNVLKTKANKLRDSAAEHEAKHLALKTELDAMRDSTAEMNAEGKIEAVAGVDETVADEEKQRELAVEEEPPYSGPHVRDLEQCQHRVVSVPEESGRDARHQLMTSAEMAQSILQLFSAEDNVLLQLPDELRGRIQAARSFDRAEARATTLEADKATLIARNNALCHEKAEMQRKRHNEVCEDLHKSNAVVEQLHKLELDYDKLKLEADKLRQAVAAQKAKQQALPNELDAKSKVSDTVVDDGTQRKLTATMRGTTASQSRRLLTSVDAEHSQQQDAPLPAEVESDASLRVTASPFPEMAQSMLQLFGADDDVLRRLPDELRERIQAAQSFEETKAHAAMLEAEKASLIARNKALCQEQADMQRKRQEDAWKDLHIPNTVIEQLRKLEADYGALKPESDKLRDSAAAQETKQLALQAELDARREIVPDYAEAGGSEGGSIPRTARLEAALSDSEARTATLESEMVRLHDEINELKAEADELRDSAAVHEATELALKAELDSARDSTRVMASAQRLLMIEKGERRRASASLDDSKARAVVLEADKARLVTEVGALKAEADELRDSAAAQEATELALKAELEAMRDSMQLMASAQRQLMAEKGERRRTSTRLDNSKARAAMLEAENTKLTAEIDALKAEADELRDSAAAHAAAELTLNAELKSMRDGTRAMTAAQRQLMFEKGERRRASVSLDNARARAAMLEAEKNALEAEAVQLRHNNSTLDREKAELRRELESSVQSCDRSKKTDAEPGAGEKAGAVAEKLRKLQADHSVLKAEAARLRRAVASAESRLPGGSEKLPDAVGKHHHPHQKAKRQLRVEEREKRRAAASLEKATAMCQQLQAEVERLKLQDSGVVAERDALQLRVATLEAERDKHHDSANELARELEQSTLLIEELHDLHMQYDALKADADKLRAERPMRLTNQPPEILTNDAFVMANQMEADLPAEADAMEPVRSKDDTTKVDPTMEADATEAIPIKASPPIEKITPEKKEPEVEDHVDDEMDITYHDHHDERHSARRNASGYVRHHHSHKKLRVRLGHPVLVGGKKQNNKRHHKMDDEEASDDIIPREVKTPTLREKEEETPEQRDLTPELEALKSLVKQLHDDQVDFKLENERLCAEVSSSKDETRQLRAQLASAFLPAHTVDEPPIIESPLPTLSTVALPHEVDQVAGVGAPAWVETDAAVRERALPTRRSTEAPSKLVSEETRDTDDGVEEEAAVPKEESNDDTRASKSSAADAPNATEVNEDATFQEEKKAIAAQLTESVLQTALCEAAEILCKQMHAHTTNRKGDASTDAAAAAANEWNVVAGKLSVCLNHHRDVLKNELQVPKSPALAPSMYISDEMVAADAAGPYLENVSSTLPPPPPRREAAIPAPRADSPLRVQEISDEEPSPPYGRRWSAARSSGSPPRRRHTSPPTYVRSDSSPSPNSAVKTLVLQAQKDLDTLAPRSRVSPSTPLDPPSSPSSRFPSSYLSSPEFSMLKSPRADTPQRPSKSVSFATPLSPPPASSKGTEEGAGTRSSWSPMSSRDREPRRTSTGPKQSTVRGSPHISSPPRRALEPKLTSVISSSERIPIDADALIEDLASLRFEGDFQMFLASLERFSDEAFYQTFNMTRDAFKNLPVWKKHQLSRHPH